MILAEGRSSPTDKCSGPQLGLLYPSLGAVALLPSAHIYTKGLFWTYKTRKKKSIKVPAKYKIRPLSWY
jgi:hypothetical protein